MDVDTAHWLASESSPLTDAIRTQAEDLVLDGQGGIVVPPRDAPALASAIRSLLADEALRTRLAAAGHERAMEFSIERAADGITSAVALAAEKR